MSIGEYRISILDTDGNPTQTIERTANGRCPAVGEQLVIDDVLYRVRAVRHEEDDGRTVRRYTTPHCYVRVVVRGRLQ